MGFNAHRLLRSIGKNTLLSKLPEGEQAQPEEWMVPENKLLERFSAYPEIIYNTKSILDDCSLKFEFGKSKNKKSFTESEKQDERKLRELCAENLLYRYPEKSKAIIDRYEKEIKAITEQGFASYFLINWDIVNYARHKNYFYVGRGSGANSLVAYLLNITDVDTVDLDLYFERFMNPFRTSPPDFDLDFSWKDRDDVIRYIFQKNKHTHTSLLATYSTFQENSVVRELGKVFGLPKADIDALQEEGILNQFGETGSLIKKYALFINDFPSHLSIHAGGILISELPMHYYAATSYPPKGFPLTQFSMIEAEDIGLYKFDILSQRGLGHIKDSLSLIYKNKGVKIDIHDVGRFKKDENVKMHMREAKCMGCFYVESPAMRMLLKKLEADTYLGLVAASSIIRPGVASSGMMREYILRSKGHPPGFNTPHEMYDILKETFGVMVYQEDVIKVAHYYAGLTLGEADMLRRGMSGKYRGREEFALVRDKFFSNCNERGYSEETTKEVWRQIESFAGYAFSKGHSASYAVESYQSLYLKAYFPLEHMVAVINNFGGFYRTEYYVHEARMNGGSIHAPDINKSDYTTTIYGSDIYLGLIHVAELESKVGEAILDERSRNGVFYSLEDFMKRVKIQVGQLRILIRIGAFRFTGMTKKELLWEIHAILGRKNKTEVVHELFDVTKNKFEIPPLHYQELEDAFDEKEILGFSLQSPFELVRESIPTLLTANDLKIHSGKIIELTGYLVTLKYTRTKYNERMMFGTFIDHKGNFFDTTHFPKVCLEFPFRGKGCYVINGKVAEEFGFYSIDVLSMRLLENHTRETTNTDQSAFII
jgi:DNA polymerase-3 subunit alpha